MATIREIILSFRRAFLLACITALAALRHSCHAFSSCPSSLAAGIRLSRHSSLKTNVVGSRRLELFSETTDGEENRSRPKIVVIKTHEDYVQFLEEDDRLCVIKFYASWCKSCRKFGIKFRHLAFDEGDLIDAEGSTVRSGEVRFAEAEYSASAKLCKSLKVKKLPTVHMYRQGEGKIADMTCKPSLFHLVVDELHRLLDGGSGAVAESLPEIRLETTTETNVGSNGNVTSTSFDGLADEIMTSLRTEEEKVGAVKEKNPWFPFTF